MNISGLPDIVDKQVTRLSKITLCSYADILLAAKILFPSIKDFRMNSLIEFSLYLEKIALEASLSEQQASKIAMDISNLAMISYLDPENMMTRKIRFMFIIGRIKYNFKTLFGLIPWIDYRTRNWFKI